MKKNRLSLCLFLLLCSLITFIACSKYKDSDIPSNNLPEDKLVTTSIQGRVLDENDQPVAGAAVSGGGKDTTTDVNGVFTFKNIQVSSRWGFVKVIKPGYFTGSRSVISGSASNYLTIRLIPRSPKGSFAAGSGGSVLVQPGDTVAFDAAAVVTASGGAAYSGNVHVYAAYLDPTDVNISKLMPGDLRGIGTDGKETVLQSFGMMAVELEGDGGEKLQLAPGKPATLTMAIPASLLAAAPATIPLWYFNDTTGQWIEQGTATKKGGSYCGTTSHFSYWNCDLPAGVVNFKVRVMDDHGAALPYTQIQFVTKTFGVRGGNTDSAGYASGLIPKGEAMEFQVISNCKTVIYGSNIGPVLTDQDLGTVTVSYTQAEAVLTGSVVNCANGLVKKGTINALIEGLSYRAEVTDGAFSLPVHRCAISPTDVKLVAVDDATGQQGEVKTVSITSGSKDVGTLTACGAVIEEYAHFTLLGKTYDILSPPDSVKLLNRDATVFGAWLIDSSATLILQFGEKLNKVGTYDLTFLIADNRTEYDAIPHTQTCTITRFDNIFGFIEGNFDATVYKSGDTTHSNPLRTTGNFRIRRTY